MTEPDDALKAFRKWARIRFPKCGADIEAGKWDRDDTAHAYRAGAAASAERIKALEGALRAWVEKECDFMRRNNLGNPEVQPHVIWSRALLKESDQ